MPSTTALPPQSDNTKTYTQAELYAARQAKARIILCEVCQSPKRTIDAKTRFCSIRCKNKSIEGRNREPRTCLQCSAIFYGRIAKTQRFCSRKCSAQNRSDWRTLKLMSDNPNTIGRVSLI